MTQCTHTAGLEFTVTTRKNVIASSEKWASFYEATKCASAFVNLEQNKKSTKKSYFSKICKQKNMEINVFKYKWTAVLVALYTYYYCSAKPRGSVCLLPR